MPIIKFVVETEARIKRLELDEYDRFVPVDMNDGNGRAELPAGYEGVAWLFLHGQVGQTAKFKIAQGTDGEDVELASRNYIEITSSTGRAAVNVAFKVQ